MKSRRTTHRETFRHFNIPDIKFEVLFASNNMYREENLRKDSITTARETIHEAISQLLMYCIREKT